MYRRSSEFNITSLIEDYQGEKLESLFPDHCSIENTFGQFTKFSWTIEGFPCDLAITKTKKKLMKNLKVVYNIGEITENEFHKRGMFTLRDLQNHLRFGKSAKTILRYIENKTYPQLLRNRYIYDIDVSFCFEMTDLLFLDIETLGLYDSPIIMIGVGYFTNDNNFHIRVLFANELESEMALCDHFRREIMPRFKCFVTYNGKSFDIPYISNRLLYFFDDNPMIRESDTPYEDINTKYHHIDLYHNCRRVFKESFQDFTLTNMERALLNSKRDNELPSNLVGLCYRRYKRNPLRYVGLIKKSIEHNYEDIRSLPLIFQKILKHS